MALEPGQCAQQALFDLAEVAAQRIVGQGAIGAERSQRGAHAFGAVALPRRWRDEIGSELARAFGLLQQRGLECGIGDAGHRHDAVLVGHAAQVGDAVFVEVDVAQVARDGGVAVVPVQVGVQRGRLAAGGTEHQHAARVVQRMRHCHEVVLAADAGHHAAVVQRIGHRRAQRGGHHARVEEARLAPLQAAQALVAIQLVDRADPVHADAGARLRRHLAQPGVELGRAEVEGALQVFAVALQPCLVVGIGAAVGHALHQLGVVEHLALDHAALDQLAEAFVEHLAAAEQADRERRQSAAFLHCRVRLQRRIQCRQHLPVARIVGMPQHQRMAQRIGQRTDADLQRAAIAHQRARIQADGVVGIGHRLPRQSEQARIRTRRGDRHVEERRLHRRAAADPRQLRIDLGDQQRPRQAAPAHRVQRVLGDVVVARERQARAVGFARHLLHDQVGRALRHRIGRMRVVEAGVVALRLRRMQQRAGLHIEFFHLDMRRQRIALQRLHILQFREVVAEMALHERPHEAAFQPAAGRRRVQ